MEPQTLVHDICRAYVSDAQDVDGELRQIVLGYNRARDVELLSTCTRHFDWHSHTIAEWRFLRQVEAFFKKNSLFAHPDRCFEQAQTGFFQNEQACSETNIRIKPFMDGTAPLEPELSVQVQKMQRYIYNVLGDCRDFISDLPNLVKVTPGATAQRPRRDSLPQLKMRLKLFCTTRAAKYVKAVSHLLGFPSMRTKVTHTNRVELVPKNWKTDRTIACEPEGNLPLQLAFDTYAKKKLRRAGIDLRDQSANQRKAKHASIHNDYATVDFSAASDTISFNTVRWLFPDDWFDFLCDVRSPAFRGVFGRGTYAKFSSMGNGATFTLETLIFAAVCHAVGSKHFLVYGDDVIIERKYYDAYVALATFLGFTVNEEKSYSAGPFRESCGGDYYDGIDVTPIFIRSIDRRKAMKCHLVNSLGRLTFPGSALGALLAKLIVDEKLPRVPFNESTLSGVWTDPQMARNQGLLCRRIVFKNGPRLDYFKCYSAKSKMRSFADVRGYYLWFLHKQGQTAFAGPWVDSQRLSPTQTSSVPIFQHVYVRRWVSWREPAEAMPDHVMWL